MIAADTNLTVYLTLHSTHTEAARSLYRQDPHWIAPTLWLSEVRHAYLKHIRQSLISVHQAFFLLRRLEALFEDRLFLVPTRSVIGLAAESGCSTYDCEFVALAQEYDCPLVTMDRKLVAAFPETARLLTD